MVAAWAILPGDWVEGTELRNGKRQKYKINGAHLEACIVSSLFLTQVLFCSILNFASHIGHCRWHNPAWRSSVIHLDL